MLGIIRKIIERKKKNDSTEEYSKTLYVTECWEASKTDKKYWATHHPCCPIQR